MRGSAGGRTSLGDHHQAERKGSDMPGAYRGRGDRPPVSGTAVAVRRCLPEVTPTMPAMSDRQFGFDTRAIHAGQRPDPETGARAMPIYATTSYVFEDAQHAADLFALQTFGNIYTRIRNPTTAAFEERMASLEGGLGALATASGQAAQLIALAHPGHSRATRSWPRSRSTAAPTPSSTSPCGAWGSTSPSSTSATPSRWRRRSPSDTKVLYGETIGNPRADVLDIAAFADLAHANGIPLMVDNTFATPYLCRPIEHGADIVVHSATKFIGGHGTAIGGVIVESGRFPFDNGRFPLLTEPSPAYHDLMFWENFREYGYLMKARVELLRDIGAAPSPFNSFLLLLGLETLPLRMQRHAENAVAVARFLRRAPRGRAGSTTRSSTTTRGPRWRERTCPEGPGAVFTFGLNGGFEAGVRFIEAVRAGLAPGQRRRRQDAGDPPGVDHPPAGPGGGAGGGGDRRRHDPHLGGHRDDRRHRRRPRPRRWRRRHDHRLWRDPRGDRPGAAPHHPERPHRGAGRGIGQPAALVELRGHLPGADAATDLPGEPCLRRGARAARCYPSLADLPEVPDIVDVFRRHDAIPEVVDEAIEVGAKVVWLQLGLRHDEAARKAMDAGLQVVQDRCLKIEHARFSGALHLAGFDTGVITSKRRRPI